MTRNEKTGESKTVSPKKKTTEDSGNDGIIYSSKATPIQTLTARIEETCDQFGASQSR
jgi:hypothetical protein